MCIFCATCRYINVDIDLFLVYTSIIDNVNVNVMQRIEFNQNTRITEEKRILWKKEPYST